MCGSVRMCSLLTPEPVNCYWKLGKPPIPSVSEGLKQVPIRTIRVFFLFSASLPPPQERKTDTNFSHWITFGGKMPAQKHHVHFSWKSVQYGWHIFRGGRRESRLRPTNVYDSSWCLDILCVGKWKSLERNANFLFPLLERCLVFVHNQCF